MAGLSADGTSKRATRNGDKLYLALNLDIERLKTLLSSRDNCSLPLTSNLSPYCFWRLIVDQFDLMKFETGQDSFGISLSSNFLVPL